MQPSRPQLFSGNFHVRYGEDGMTAEYIEDQDIELMKISHERLAAIAKHDYLNPDYGRGWIKDEKVRSNIRMNHEVQAVLDREFENLKEMKRLLCEGEWFGDDDGKEWYWIRYEGV